MILKNDPNRSISSNMNEKKLHPLILFIGAYCIYNILGLLNMPWSVQNAYSKELPWALFLIGLAGCIAGYILFGRKRDQERKIKVSTRKSKVLGSIFLLIFLACIAITVITNKGIPLLLGEARFSNSAILFNLAPLFGFWVMLRTISDLEGNTPLKKVPILIYCLGIITFGYRAPVLIATLTIYFYFTTFRFERKKTIRHAGATAAIFIAASAVFAGYRISQEYEASEFFKNVDFQYVSEHTYVAPLVPVLAMFDFSQQTVSDIGSNLKSHMNGELLLSNYKALLPGSYWGARNIVGDITNARWVNNRPMSITPTLQGALFIDFGYLGVFFGFLLISSSTCILKEYAKSRSALTKLIFCYLFTVTLLSIHSGYWDISVLFFAFFVAVLKLYDALKAIYPKAQSHSLKIGHLT